MERSPRPPRPPRQTPPELLTRMVADYQGGLSIPQISEAIGWPRSTVRARLLGAGVTLRTAVDGMRKAKREGRGISPMAGKHERTPAIRAAVSAGRLAWSDKYAKGYRITSQGYLEVTRGPYKGRLLHIVIMEVILGRAMRPDEVVHHKDHNRTNNDPRNLEVMSASAHSRMHINERIAAGEKMGLHFTSKERAA